MFKNILVPTDGSDLSKTAVNKAVDFAKKAGARLTFFYAKGDHRVELYGKTILADPSVPGNLGSMAEAHAQEVLAECMRAAEAAGVEATSCTATTNVAYEGIIAAANDNHCDLIFMASHGRRGVKALLLGSETNKVLTHSKIPVLVFR